MTRLADRTTRNRRAWRGALLSGAAALVLACSGTLSLDADRLEQAIQAGIQEQTGLTVSEVACPDDTPLAQDNVSQCTATTSDGQQLTVEVTQTDAAGNVNWRLI